MDWLFCSRSCHYIYISFLNWMEKPSYCFGTFGKLLKSHVHNGTAYKMKWKITRWQSSASGHNSPRIREFERRLRLFSKRNKYFCFLTIWWRSLIQKGILNVERNFFNTQSSTKPHFEQFSERIPFERQHRVHWIGSSLPKCAFSIDRRHQYHLSEYFFLTLRKPDAAMSAHFARFYEYTNVESSNLAILK